MEKPKLQILTNTGIVEMHSEHLQQALHFKGQQTRLAVAAKQPIEERTQQNLLQYPCPARGEYVRIQKREGGCSCTDSPIFRCSNEISNLNDGEASLWKYAIGNKQKHVACAKCPVRENLLNVSTQPDLPHLAESSNGLLEVEHSTS